MNDNLPDALRYYQHALNVLTTCHSADQVSDGENEDKGNDVEAGLAADSAKVHISIAQIQK